MSYVIAAISNAGGAPEQAYRKMQSAGACPERPYAGMLFVVLVLLRSVVCLQWNMCFILLPTTFYL
jgi:hypothetical protein